MCPCPGPQESLEKQLVRALAEQKQKEPDVLWVNMEEKAYRSLSLGVKMDLFVVRRDSIEVYEARKRRSQALDLYQLRMYWDGCAIDGRPVTSAILAAPSHPNEVEALVRTFNDSYRDPTGQPYHFSLLTWGEVGIDLKAV